MSTGEDSCNDAVGQEDGEHTHFRDQTVRSQVDGRGMMFEKRSRGVRRIIMGIVKLLIKLSLVLTTAKS